MKDSLQEMVTTARTAQILDAAARVFAKKGFHSATIKDIAKEAGIGDGTIYNYFENKTALLLGIFDRMSRIARQDESLVNAPSTDLRAFLTAYLRQPLMAFKGDNFELFRVVMSEIMVNSELRAVYYRNVLAPTLAMAESYIQQWVDQGLIKPVNVGLTMRAISGMVMGLTLEYVMGDQPLEAAWDELPDFLTDLILDGLRSTQYDHE